MHTTKVEHTRFPDIMSEGGTVPPRKYCTGWRGVKGPQDGNTSGFLATGHRVLLQVEVVETKTSGGIVLLDKTADAEKNHGTIATVVEVGPDAWSDKSTDYCAVGDKVLVGLYCGTFRTGSDGKEYRFVSDLDIISPVVE